MTNRFTNSFDLEQQIIACWNITDDLDYVLELTGKLPNSKELDEVQNLLIGIKQLYQLKFEKCFNTFEKCLAEGSFRESEDVTKNWPDWDTEK